MPPCKRAGQHAFDRLPSITCPAFTGWGRFDGIAPHRLSAAIASHITGAQLHTYQGATCRQPTIPPGITDAVSL